MVIFFITNSYADIDRVTAVLKQLAHAAPCIVNQTHCHCAMSKPALGQICYQPIPGQSNRCEEVACEEAYKCDCASSHLRTKASVMQYTVKKTPGSTLLHCDHHEANVPTTISGKTTKFHVVSHEMFALFINKSQIGYAVTPEYKVLTTELTSGKVIGIMMQHQQKHKYGAKLRFSDLLGQTRYLDESWLCSNSYHANWLDDAFDPVAEGWGAPSVNKNMTDAAFDSKAPWMWYGHAQVTYCRYPLP